MVELVCGSPRRGIKGHRVGECASRTMAKCDPGYDIDIGYSGFPCWPQEAFVGDAP
jgi:hypothetical protein